MIVEAHGDARVLPATRWPRSVSRPVYTGGTDVFASRAATDWLCLLEAFEQPHRSGLVRAAATTMFFGESAATSTAGGDELTDRVAETLREWADRARDRGLAAVLEAAVGGLAPRVLGWRGGERDMTDLRHVAQVLHEVAHRERLGWSALLDWLRAQCAERGGSAERNRRLDSDAAAVQIVTIRVSKGLQYPLVYLPFGFNRYVPTRDIVLYHDDDGRRCLDIGGAGQPGFEDDQPGPRGEGRRRHPADLRRADPGPVPGRGWWAPSGTSQHPAGRCAAAARAHPEAAQVPDRCRPKPSDDRRARVFRALGESAGGPVVPSPARGGTAASWRSPRRGPRRPPLHAARSTRLGAGPPTPA